MSPRSRSHRSRDILLLHGAQLGARRGRRRRRCRWAAAARARAARRGAAPCSATTRARDATTASGTETTGCETRHTGRRRSRTERRRAHQANHGAWRGFCTQVLVSWPSGSSSTSSAQATRVSKRRLCGWWARPSSSLGLLAVCCALPSAYLRSHAAGGGPITRRTEDCPGAGKAKRCRSLAGAGPARALRSARRRGGSSRPPATCPACRAEKKTKGCAGTALLRLRRICHCLRCNRAYNKVRSKIQKACKFKAKPKRCGRALPSRAHRDRAHRPQFGRARLSRALFSQAHLKRALSSRAQRLKAPLSRAALSRARFSRAGLSRARSSRALLPKARSTTPAREGLRPGTSRSPAAPMANSSSVLPNCAPKPTSNKGCRNTPFYTRRTI